MTRWSLYFFEWNFTLENLGSNSLRLNVMSLLWSDFFLLFFLLCPLPFPYLCSISIYNESCNQCQVVRNLTFFCTFVTCTVLISYYSNFLSVWTHRFQRDSWLLTCYFYLKTLLIFYYIPLHEKTRSCVSRVSRIESTSRRSPLINAIWTSLRFISHIMRTKNAVQFVNKRPISRSTIRVEDT